MTDAYDWVLDAADEQARGEMNSPKGPFASRPHLVQEGRKDEFTPGEIKAAVDRAAADGELMRWHGLLVPNDEDRLRAVIEYEQDREIPRRILIGKCNKFLAGDIEAFTSTVEVADD